jgi:hypothetical protein
MIISINQAVQRAAQLLPKFDVNATSFTNNGGQRRLQLAIEVRPGQVNSRGEDLPVGSYKSWEDIPLFLNGVEDSDVDEAVQKMKTYLITHDQSNGWTNLF